MTTICYKDGVLATDTRAMHCGWISHEAATKVILAEIPTFGKCYVGISGHYTAGVKGLEHLTKGENYKPIDEDTCFTLLAVNKFGSMRVWCSGELNTVGEFIPSSFHAIGSGQVPAKAAMHAGASAIEAVRIASYLDPNTGGTLVSYKIADL